MLDGLAELWRLAPLLILALCRVGALFFTAPLLGGPFIPGRAKALLTLAIAALLLPGLAQAQSVPVPLDGRFILLIAQELAVGATIGFACTCIFEGVRAGGELINRYAGFTAAENFDPESGVGEGPVGDMLLIGMVLVFLAADAHLHLIASVARSFQAVPLGAFTGSPDMLHAAARGTGECMALACAVSAPVLAVILLITVAEGVLAKAVPQINIIFISFSVKILAALLTLYAGIPAIVAFMGACIGAMHALVGGTIDAMRP